MSLKTYLFGLSMADRARLADRCGTTYGHLRNVSYGQKPCAAELAINIERETSGAVRCEDLRPDVDWGVLRATATPNLAHEAG